MGNTKCPVCETPMELQTDFCPTCGFERRIFPNGVSGEVQADENECIAKAKEFENERIAKAREFYGTYEAAKSAADNAKAAADEEMQSKLDEANEALAKEQTELNKTKTALKKEQTALKDEKAAHEETKSDLANEKEAHNKTKTALKNEKAAHEETKSDLAYEQEAHKQTKKALDDLKKNPQTPPHNKKVIGKALFTQGGRSEAVDLYEGGCIVTAPAWTNVKGELFEIQPNGDDYILTDLKGYMYNRLGNSISSNGVFTFNDDYFTIGNLLIKLSLPENN